MPSLLVLLFGFALSAVTYFYLERLRGARAWVPAVCRGIAWGALGLLLMDLTCHLPGSRAPRPLVLLDGSLSLRAAGGRWQEARDSALRWGGGEMRVFGDERPGGDTATVRGRSLLLPALEAGTESGRPVVIVTDGEIEDAADLPRDLLRTVAIRVFARRPMPDLAITRVDGPTRLATGDSLILEIEIRSVGPTAPDSVRVELRDGRGILAGRTVHPNPGATVRLTLRGGGGRLEAGDHLLTVALANAGDAEPRDDARLIAVTVTRTPGILLVASPADWDSRFLFQSLKGVTQLPVRGFVRLTPDHWRSMVDLHPTPTVEVRQAVAAADLVVGKGSVDDLLRGSRARGIWRWPSGEGGERELVADWYLAPKPSPIAGAFVGLPVDSFPPAIQISPLTPGPSDWVGLIARAGRSGSEQAVMVGRESRGLREVVTAADGLWRLGFRGGSSEAGYRAWVAATVNWLLGGADSSRGRARPLRPVVTRARPLVFEWTGGRTPAPLAITLDGSEGTLLDTLRFDGNGRAQLWPPVGRYRYRLEGGGSGVVAVEDYSDEWLPRPQTLGAQAEPPRAASHATNARQWLWLFAVAIIGFAGEWTARRWLGLR